MVSMSSPFYTKLTMFAKLNFACFRVITYKPLHVNQQEMNLKSVGGLFDIFIGC